MISYTDIPTQLVHGLHDARHKESHWGDLADGRVNISNWVRTRACIAKVKRYQSTLAILMILLFGSVQVWFVERRYLHFDTSFQL